MSLLEKAFRYRQKFLNAHSIGSCKGLLNRAFEYLRSKIGKKKSPFDIKKANDISLTQENKTFTKTNEPINTIDILSEQSAIDQESIYHQTIIDISKEMSTFSIDKKAYIKFNNIIAQNFNFTKNALLIYSPHENKFIFWDGTNIDQESTKKLSIDLEYKDIYKRMVKENYFIIHKDDKNFLNLEEIISKNDFNDTDFQLYIPFIFSDHVVGIFLGLKMKNSEIPNKKLINSMEIIGKLNGALLYSIFQRENMIHTKKKF